MARSHQIAACACILGCLSLYVWAWIVDMMFIPGTIMDDCTCESPLCSVSTYQLTQVVPVPADCAGANCWRLALTLSGHDNITIQHPLVGTSAFIGAYAREFFVNESYYVYYNKFTGAYNMPPQSTDASIIKHLVLPVFALVPYVSASMCLPGMVTYR
jgi:hypothetical protein